MSFHCFHLLKAIKRNRHSRGDGYLGLCLFFNLLQVSALLPDQSSNQTVVGQDLHRNILSSTEAKTQVNNYIDAFKEHRKIKTDFGRIRLTLLCHQPLSA